MSLESTGTNVKTRLWRQFQPDGVGHSTSRGSERNSDLDPTLQSPHDDPNTSRILESYIQKETTVAKGAPFVKCSSLALLRGLWDRMRQQRGKLQRALLFVRYGIASRTKVCSDLVVNR